MTTQVTVARSSQTGTINHEDYSLYSSMSEQELIEMAIEQSLTEGSPEQTAAKTAAREQAQAAPSEPYYCQNFYLYPWQRHAAQSGGQTQTSSSGSPSGVWRRYDGTLFKKPQPEVPDPIVSAIREGDEETLLAMIKSGRNLSEPNKDGWLPLHEAAYYGQNGCLKLLQKSYPGTIDQRTLQEETPLYLATNKGHLECVHFLLQAGAEPDIANKARETPLYKACERKNIDAVQILLQYNADANHRCNRGWTALHEAVGRNDLEIIDLLIKGGAKVESANCYGITSLFVAAESGHLEALRYLAKC
ncbi:PREDICTED: ankyrin repeat and SOCS box protein 2, partial [Gekko japonicus]|uniref:Ankyrin repeat and SOCS box protein 2 n=1 Tax=Gekko japonicus TaxID=146911 RepID=A0ABM1KBB3_GEKJA